EVSDPASSAAAANGQFLLVKRDVYDRVGGHALVAHTLLEDVALAAAVKRAGGRLRFRYAADAVETRMYRSFPAMWDGWTKNLALLFPHSLQLAARRGIEFLFAAAALGMAITGIARNDSVIAWAGFLIAVPT